MRNRGIYFLFLLIYASGINLYSQTQFQNNKVNIEIISSQDKVLPNSKLKVCIKAIIDEKWHINSDKPAEDYLIPAKLSIQNDSIFSLQNITFPEAENLTFGFSEKPVSVFEKEISIFADLIIPAVFNDSLKKITFQLSYQACDNQTCLAPATAEADLEIIFAQPGEIITPINQQYFQISSAETEKDDLFAGLESSGMFWILATVFLWGLALNLTPCVYPLIPITIGYFGGQSEGRTGKLFIMGLLYLTGMAITYSVIGVVTALSGAILGSLLQNSIVVIGIAVVFVILALSMFGVYEFKLPDFLVMKAGGAKSGVFGAFFMGLTMGIVAAPCIGPVVLALVTHVGSKGDPYYGFTLFFFLALGLGLPYLVLALFSGKIKSLPKAGIWMESVKHIFGLLLLGMALYYLNPILPKGIQSFILPVYLIISALYLLFVDKAANKISAYKWIKALLSVIFIISAIYMLVPAEKDKLDWKVYSSAEFEKVKPGKKIILDFYADWCIPCKELDALTFSNPEVKNILSDYERFKIDLTSAMSDETENLKNMFVITGVPTIIIFNSDGEETERITGFIPAKEMIEKLNNIK